MIKPVCLPSCIIAGLGIHFSEMLEFLTWVQTPDNQWYFDSCFLSAV